MLTLFVGSIMYSNTSNNISIILDKNSISVCRLVEDSLDSPRVNMISLKVESRTRNCVRQAFVDYQNFINQAVSHETAQEASYLIMKACLLL